MTDRCRCCERESSRIDDARCMPGEHLFALTGMDCNILVHGRVTEQGSESAAISERLWDDSYTGVGVWWTTKACIRDRPNHQFLTYLSLHTHEFCYSNQIMQLRSKNTIVNAETEYVTKIVCSYTVLPFDTHGCHVGIWVLRVRVPRCQKLQMTA